MASIILPDRWKRQPQGAVEVDTNLLGFEPRKVFVGDQTPGYTKGSSVKTGAAQPGRFIGVDTTIHATTVDSAYTIDLGSRPSSASFLIIAERNIDCSATNSIPFVFNCRTGNEANYSALALGNSYAPVGSKNKLHVTGVGDVVTHNFVNGRLDSYDKEYPTNVALNICTTYSSLLGSEYKLLAKDDVGSGYVAPLKVYLFLEMPPISNALAQWLSKHPWQIFKKKKQVFYSFGSSFPVLSSLAVSNITSSGGRLTASA